MWETWKTNPSYPITFNLKADNNMNVTITKVNNGFTVGHYEPGNTIYESGTHQTNVFTSEATLFKFLSKQFAKTEA